MSVTDTDVFPRTLIGSQQFERKISERLTATKGRHGKVYSGLCTRQV